MNLFRRPKSKGSNDPSPTPESTPTAPETAQSEDFLRAPTDKLDAPESETPPQESLADTQPLSSPTKPVVEPDIDSPTKPLQTMPSEFVPTRQLEPVQTFISTPGKHIAVGMKSDVGMVRQNNQDSLLVFNAMQIGASPMPDFGFFVVADGMGGHEHGERASMLAARMIGEYVMREFYLKLVASGDPTADDMPFINEVLIDALNKANEVVSAEIPEGGTTVTAAALMGDMAYIAHVGDSRAYLITMDGMEQVTRDHSLVQRLIELEHLTPEEAQRHPQRNVLYRALGQSENLEIDTLTRRLPPGARLMLCSDGLWSLVPEEKIISVLGAASTPQEACDRLVKMANERGGNDNVTVIIVQMPG